MLRPLCWLIFFTCNVDFAHGSHEERYGVPATLWPSICEPVTQAEFDEACPDNKQGCDPIAKPWHTSKCSICGHCVRPICREMMAPATCPSAPSGCLVAND